MKSITSPLFYCFSNKISFLCLAGILISGKFPFSHSSSSLSYEYLLLTSIPEYKHINLKLNLKFSISIILNPAYSNLSNPASINEFGLAFVISITYKINSFKSLILYNYQF